MTRRLCFLESSYEGSASAFEAYDAWGDLSDVLAGYEVERHALVKATAVRDVCALAAGPFDVFVNFCDGALDEERAGVEVVHTLERLGVPFTGPTSGFYEPSRQAMKDACRAAGIDAPRGALVCDVGDLSALDGLPYPLLVKHPSSYGSIGLSADSKVSTPEALAAQVRHTVARFGGALVEEFVAGREFSVLVVEGIGGDGPRALRAVEVLFPAGDEFAHFDLKWVRPHDLAAEPVLDEPLDARLRDLSQRFFTAMGGTGHARCDLRMDAAGRLFMLEINPNCGVFLPAALADCADVALAHDPMGRRGFFDHLVRSAFNRCAAVAP